jgi:hypothetical protein
VHDRIQRVGEAIAVERRVERREVRERRGQ